MAAEYAEGLDAGPLAQTQRLAATLLAAPETTEHDAQTRQAAVEVFCRRLLAWLEERKGDSELAARLAEARGELRDAAAVDIRGIVVQGLRGVLQGMLGDQYEQLYGSDEPPDSVSAEYLGRRDQLDAAVVQYADELQASAMVTFDALLGSDALRADLAAWAWR